MHIFCQEKLSISIKRIHDSDNNIIIIRDDYSVSKIRRCY